MAFRKTGQSAQNSPSGKKTFGHAAYDPADVEDARRGNPAVSLQAFAAASGLDYRASEQAGAFLSTLPTWPDYIFNVCRGTMPSGRLGQLAHELFEVEAHNGTVRAAGEFYDVRVLTRTSGWEVAGIQQGPRENKPFAGNAVWIPTTTAHVRAPETNHLGVLRIARSTSFRGIGDKELERFGLPGFRAIRGEDDQVLAAVSEACRPWLTSRLDPHLDLCARYGLVALTVNGYRADNSDLQSLLTSADGIAHAIGALTLPALNTPFTTPGPAAGTVPRRAGVPLPHPLLVPAYAQTAIQLGMHDEDFSHVMALLPRCPIPGIASGVLAGSLPGTTTPCRLVWFEQGGRTSGSTRGGVIVPAAPGAATPLGGTLNQQTGIYEEVVDGMTFCWRKQRSFNSLDTNEIVSAATATLRASGLAAI